MTANGRACRCFEFEKLKMMKYTKEEITTAAGYTAIGETLLNDLFQKIKELRLERQQNNGKQLVSGSLPQPTIEQIVEDLDDKRICKFSDLPADMYYLSRKHTAEYLLDKYIIVKRQ